MADMHHKPPLCSSYPPPPESADDISLLIRQFLSSSSSSSFPSLNSKQDCEIQRQLTPQSFGISISEQISRPSSGGAANITPNTGPYVSSSSVGTVDYDPDEYDCESEEGFENLVEEMAAKPNPPRNPSKRARAAEVHNLSEKQRRSRINEKMKALQKLIPNSNKTDKASMLDEAIEYLKQLQLQVQMLTMRNGINLYSMCAPAGILPQNDGIQSASMAANQETLVNPITGLPVPNQPSMLDFSSHSINEGPSFGS